jgi:exodeoxyribonuclease V alpha subunit
MKKVNEFYYLSLPKSSLNPMQTLDNVHEQFASLFKNKDLEPFAYLASRKLSEGHICVDLNDLDSETDEFPYKTSSGKNRINPSVLKKIPELVSVSEKVKKPFIVNNDLFYIQRYFAYETMILERIKKFLASEKGEFSKRQALLSKNQKLITALFSKQPALQNIPPDECVDWQLAAAVSAVLNNFTIITGGPGTGKTTTVAKILAILFSLDPDLRVALTAPTGKAAMRMAESLRNSSKETPKDLQKNFESLVPLTIHRLLGYVKDSPYFRHCAEDPLNYDLVIVDESSMIDVALFAKLLDAIGPNTQLIMLGDRNQLASVEAGSLFSDLCQSAPAQNLFTKDKATFINSFITDAKRQITPNYITAKNAEPLFEHIVELKRSHRFIGSEGIGKFSRAVIGNVVAEIKEFAGNKDKQVRIDSAYSESVFKEFIEGYESYIKEADITLALKKLNELRVLCAVREGEHGIYVLNRKIQDHLHAKGWLKLDSLFYHNRPIIVTTNNYNLGLFNGDVGLIRTEGGKTLAWFLDSEGGIKSVLPGYIDKAETVFAMTIHKSQGSEFDKVLVVLPEKKESQLLTRELLYTAVTRAKSHVIVQGKEEVILNAAAQKVKRASGIKERF